MGCLEACRLPVCAHGGGCVPCTGLLLGLLLLLLLLLLLQGRLQLHELGVKLLRG
jgi:hypothetical protein